jgi:phage terminase small subunit
MKHIASIQAYSEALPAVEPIKKSRSAPDPETGLTEKQEFFSQEIIAGANFSTAYRRAYDASGMADATVWARASELASDGKVRARLQQLAAQKEDERRMQAACLSQFVVEGWKQLAQQKIVHKDGTVEKIPPAVRTRNLELIAKHLGMFVERIETADVTDRSADEIEADIRARLAQHSMGSA